MITERGGNGVAPPTGMETHMAIMTRRSVLRSSLALGALGTLPRPHIATAAATTIDVWWVQGFAQEEGIPFKQIVGAYQTDRGRKDEHRRSTQCAGRRQ